MSEYGDHAGDDADEPIPYNFKDHEIWLDDYWKSVDRINELLGALDEVASEVVALRFGLGQSWEGGSNRPQSFEAIGAHLGLSAEEAESRFEDAMRFLAENGRDIPHRE